MPIYEIRSRRINDGKPVSDVYSYSDFPENVRIQIQYILRDAIGQMGDFPSYNTWDQMREILCREWGQFSLANKFGRIDVFEFLLTSKETYKILDFLELALRGIDQIIRDYSDLKKDNYGIKQDADDAIKEFNFRLREAAIGYQYESAHIIRVDDQYLHKEVVIPALAFLKDRRFEGAQKEFLDAHSHYRAGENRDAISDANNAFESTMKSVCEIQGWEYEKGARSSDLVKILKRQGLLPDYLLRSFEQLVSTLASGLPKLRNEEADHGHGSEVRTIPDFMASYALHLAAAKIVFLVEAMNAMDAKKK